jgi:hypothetical protein
MIRDVLDRRRRRPASANGKRTAAPKARRASTNSHAQRAGQIEDSLQAERSREQQIRAAVGSQQEEALNSNRKGTQWQSRERCSS